MNLVVPPAWRLVGVEVRAFDRARPLGWFGRAAFAAGTGLALVAFHRRVHPSGRAMCLLGPCPGRIAAVIGGVLVVLAVVAALSPVAAGTVLVAISLLALPSAVRAVRGLPATAALRHASPPGRHVYLHSLASTKPGDGAELLRMVTAEADDKGWSIVLDAGNVALVGYYERFGFQARCRPVRGPNGGQRVRMWRPAPEPGRVNKNTNKNTYNDNDTKEKRRP
jgi:hypothetical protein